MRIEPISNFTGQAAVTALRELRKYYDALAAKALAESNYLRELGRGVDRVEAEAAKNARMFAVFRNHGEAQNKALRDYARQHGQ